LPFASRAYALGVAKAKAAGDDLATLEQHTQALNAWYGQFRARLQALTTSMEQWYEEQSVKAYMHEARVDGLLLEQSDLRKRYPLLFGPEVDDEEIRRRYPFLLDEEPTPDEDRDIVPLVGVFMDRFTAPVTSLGLGVWGLYQTGFLAALAGPARGEAEERMLNYVAVNDEDTCDPCAEAAAGSPYPASECPLPGEICEGRDKCRCEIEVAD